MNRRRRNFGVPTPRKKKMPAFAGQGDGAPLSFIFGLVVKNA
jgi:hypothetical protein